jgi:hypothetical protein
MFFAKKREQIRRLFQHPYRIVVFNDLNLHIIRQVRFNPRTLLITLIGAVILIIIGVTVLIAFTPLREYIPGYTSNGIRQTLIQNVLKVDSLEHQIQMRDKYYRDFKLMIMGQSPVDTLVKKAVVSNPEEVKYKYNADSLFKDELARESVTLTAMSPSSQQVNINDLNFIPPLKGVVTNRQDISNGHYGIDIVGKKDAPIAAALSGTVILAEWTTETGYVIQIQHENNLITVYKHNSRLLKKEGERVKAGETIAIMGNTGKETTGPHVHFEMWMNGACLNPEDYIKF